MVIFSLGEMLASPKFSEFLGNIAPPDKKAMWIGFSQAPILIGATIEGKVGPQLYHMWSDKDVFSREMLVERGLDPSQVTVAALPLGEAFHKLVAVTGETPAALTRLLYETHHIGATWYFFAFVGVVSAVLIWCLRPLDPPNRRDRKARPASQRERGLATLPTSLSYL